MDGGEPVSDYLPERTWNLIRAVARAVGVAALIGGMGLGYYTGGVGAGWIVGGVWFVARLDGYIDGLVSR